MKKLIDFLREHKNDNKPHRIIAAPLEKQSSEYTFEEFCNDVDNYSDYKIEELWEAYQCTKFIPGSYQYLGLSYEEWLYETEMLVASSQKVFEYIKENFLDWFESYDDIDNKYTDFVY